MKHIDPRLLAVLADSTGLPKSLIESHVCTVVGWTEDWATARTKRDRECDEYVQRRPSAASNAVVGSF